MTKRTSPSTKQQQPVSKLRYGLLLFLWGACAVGLLVRAVDLQVVQHDPLDREANLRNMRIEPLAAHRGMVFDRNGKPLAVSTPVTTLWANPQELMAERGRWSALQGNGVLSAHELEKLVLPRAQREFIYLKRRLAPAEAQKVLDLGIPGIYALTEYRRYYPAGPVASQVVGIAGMDGNGQEGIELSFNDTLSGEQGRERVIRDRQGSVVQILDVLTPAEPGRDLVLSIDLRVQYAAYQALVDAIKQFNAESGSVVVLDAWTGEVLAMVNQPTYNPNSLARLKASDMRNRAVTDVFEPGSTMKPFTVAAALESGLVTVNSSINTNPGYIRVDGFTIRDHRNYGMLDVTSVLTKSSNVGASKLALSLDAQSMANFFAQLGFGQDLDVSFPGASRGSLPLKVRWSKAERAALSYGYGLSTTVLQLAHAYAALANDGVMLPLSLEKVTAPPVGRRVVSQQVAHSLIAMLETVVGEQGTARLASVPGYRVAGKTGTSHKASGGSYSTDQYVGVFAGVAPAPEPRYVTVVMIDAPKGSSYYGGLVAAPAFSRVMAEVMRIRKVDPQPDDLRYASAVEGGDRS